MVARLIMFLLGYAAMLLVPVGIGVYLGRHRLGGWWTERQRVLKGKRNAALLESAEHMRCRFCLEMCNSDTDCADENGWYHSNCLETLLK